MLHYHAAALVDAEQVTDFVLVAVAAVAARNLAAVELANSLVVALDKLELVFALVVVALIADLAMTVNHQTLPLLIVHFPSVMKCSLCRYARAVLLLTFRM